MGCRTTDSAQMNATTLAIVILSAFGLIATTWIALRLRRRAAAGAKAPLHGLREREFEALVAEAFRIQGYESIASTGRQSAAFSGLVMRRERTTFLIECRHWRTGKVGADAVHALQRTMVSRGAAAGFMLSGGRFSREAVAVAGTCSVQLIDGPALETLLARVKGR